LKADRVIGKMGAAGRIQRMTMVTAEPPRTTFRRPRSSAGLIRRAPVWVAIALAMSTLVWAADPRPAFDLDVKAGMFDTFAISDVGPVTGAEIEFEVREVRHDPKWAASFNFEVNDGTSDSKMRRYAALQLSDQGGGALRAFVATSTGGAQPQRTDLGFSVQPRARLTIALDWSDEGHLKAHLTGHAVDTKVDFPMRQLLVFVSTGRLIGHSLKLLGPPR